MRMQVIFTIATLCCCLAMQDLHGAPTTAEELISPALIDRAGWTWNWQVKLPLRANETVARMMVYDDYVYILTDSNLLFCLERTTGTMRFLLPLSTRTLPISGPMYREKKLWFLVGNEMIVVDPWAGTIAEKHVFAQIGNVYEAGLAMNDTYIYITDSDRRLHAFARDGYWRAFTATADNDSPIISLSAAGERVLFATQAGNVVAMTDDGPIKLWQFDTTGTIRSELVVQGEMGYIGSHDAKLYKFEVRNGRPAWPKPFHAGDRLTTPVVLGRKLVYLSAGTMGVYGIDQESGQAVWQVPEGVSVLTETPTQSFVMSRPGTLKVMDNSTGLEIYSVNFSQVKRFAVMMSEPRLYVADKDGRVAAITVR